MIRLAVIAALVLSGNIVQASGWSGFYTSREPEAAASGPVPGAKTDPATSESACIGAILAAQERYAIPDNILLGIGLQEAGRKLDGELTVWPWAVNAAGEGRYFDSAAEAIGWVNDRLSRGVRSIDVGCMQINLRWHPEAFQTLKDGFDPIINADYAARFLVDLYRRTGNWAVAAGSYHSFTPEKRERYLKSLRRNVAVANQRLEEFRQLAELEVEVKRNQRVTTDATDTNAPGVFWSASLSDAGSDGGRSIYSGALVQPILPDFRRQP